MLAFCPFCPAQQESADVEIRLANSMPLEGTFQSAAPEGLTIQTSKGVKTLPWKYLSAGTRWRYERPMREEIERKRIKAEKEAKAKAEAAAKAAAAKAAAAKAAATNKSGKASSKTSKDSSGNKSASSSEKKK